MKLVHPISFTLLLAGITTSCTFRPPESAIRDEKPNILWITCEDMSPHLGCYGDEVAHTPVIDELASEGIRFTHAFSVSGVCAPSRAALITGLYPTSFGAMHMRTMKRTSALDQITDPELLAIPTYEAVPPAEVSCFTEYLRKAGYYCTNNHKTDYQFRNPITAWDESSTNAHWRNRQEGQPFFSVFNFGESHESQIWAREGDPSFTDPDDVIVPPYYPDTPVIRKDLARMYDNIRLVDQRVGELLQQLEEDGLTDETIVFFFSDHGDGTPRAKRWLYDSGIRVPLIVKFPDGSGAGTVTGRLVSFVDFAPTVLSLAQISIPGYMHGKAFLGREAAKPRDYVYGARDRMDPATDMQRFVRDKRYKYIKNYEPWKPYVQWIPYRDQMDLMQELYRVRDAGGLDSIQRLWFRETRPDEELYDVKNDPHEIYNLADEPGYADKLNELRRAHERWVETYGDLGDLPETELIRQLWPPDGEQPSTRPVEVRIENDTLTLHCPTPGASIAYQLPSDTAGEEDHWKLYHDPIPWSAEQSLRSTAIRIGFRQSDTIHVNW